jgi:hypothetical protein
MTEVKNIQHQEHRAYTHKEGKYFSLNAVDQTPAFWVVGQPYKLGTGMAVVVENSSKHVIRNSGCSYKKFLSMLLKRYKPDQFKAVKWVPQRIMSAEKLAQQQSDSHECVTTCVQPGLVCIDRICQNGA